MNLNRNGLFSILGSAFGTFVSDFQNYALRNKHGAVDKSKVSVGNISCQLLRLDTGSRLPAGSIEFCVRTVAFLSLRHVDILQTVCYFESHVERTYQAI